jgi:hypothetical protein
MQNTKHHPDREKIAAAIEKLSDLPTLPQVAQRVVELSQDPKTSYRDLKTVILPDPPLAAKVMMMANSAFYHRRDPAKTLEEAIFTIGLNNLVAICSSVGVLNIFRHRFRFSLPLDKLPDYFPHHLDEPDSFQVVVEMKDRYQDHIRQADTIADLMTDWL